MLIGKWDEGNEDRFAGPSWRYLINSRNSVTIKPQTSDRLVACVHVCCDAASVDHPRPFPVINFGAALAGVGQTTYLIAALIGLISSTPIRSYNFLRIRVRIFTEKFHIIGLENYY